MDNDNQKQKLTFNHHHQSNVNQDAHTNNAVANANLASMFHNLTSTRRVQESTSSLKSVSEESFTTTSCGAERTTFAAMATMASSSQRETTGGGNEMLTDEDKKSSLVGSPMMMELGACPIGRMMFAQQQEKQQSSIASSSSSSSLETLKKTKTLSFLHNEDLFSDGSGMMVSSGSQLNDDKLVPTASHLIRSISFQEQRRQNQKSSLQRCESGRETGSRLAILSPKHSLQELNERMRQHHMRVSQQMFYGSSELSM